MGHEHAGDVRFMTHICMSTLRGGIWDRVMMSKTKGARAR